MIETSGPAAIYVRISEDRDGERLGVERQLADCRKLAKRLGWTVSQVYEDNDLSASKVKVTRPAYQRLLEDIAAGKVRRLIIDKPDRLYRRNTELERLIDVVGDRVEIRTAKSGDIDLSTTNGRMVARILGATAQGEAETIRDRIKRKMASLVEAGAWKGGPRPFGWEPDGTGALREIPAEVELLREAKKRVLKGDSIRSICRDWRARGVASTRGIPIAETTLRKMLLSDRVVGHYPDGVQGQWSAIFSEAELQQLRAVLGTKLAKPREGGKFMLTGAILRCGRCGGPMYGRLKYAGRPRPYYACHQQNGGCGRVAMDVTTLDKRVMEAVSEHLTGYLYPVKSGGKYPHKAREIRTSPDLAAAMLAVSKVRQRETALAELVAEGQMSKADYMAAKAKLDPQRAAAQTALEATQAHAAGLRELAALDFYGFVKHWRDMDTAARRKVVLAVATQIRVKPHSGHPSHPDLERVEVDFRSL